MSKAEAALSQALKACRILAAFKIEVFVGLPLCLDGKPIDHTKLNEAMYYAELALENSGEQS